MYKLDFSFFLGLGWVFCQDNLQRTIIYISKVFPVYELKNYLIVSCILIHTCRANHDHSFS